MRVLKRFNALLPAIQEVYQLLILVPHKNIVFDIDDTLIFDDYRNTPNQQVRALLLYLQQRDYNVHLVTARVNDAEMKKTTKEELDQMGIKLRKGRDTLALCPDKMRETMASVSAWKAAMRKANGPVALTVGDQWGDLMEIKSEDELDALDAAHGTAKTPWLIVDPQDGIASYGLKLMA